MYCLLLCTSPTIVSTTVNIVVINIQTRSRRHQLSQAELREEVRALQTMGHKRLLLEAGEDDKNCPIEYILECIETIYAEKFENGSIRK